LDVFADILHTSQNSIGGPAADFGHKAFLTTAFGYFVYTGFNLGGMTLVCPGNGQPKEHPQSEDKYAEKYT
jgi:hypothetical protein